MATDNACGTVRSFLVRQGVCWTEAEAGFFLRHTRVLVNGQPAIHPDQLLYRGDLVQVSGIGQGRAEDAWGLLAEDS